MNETELFTKRIGELAGIAASHGRFVFTDFLTLAEQSEVNRLKNRPGAAEVKLFGGAEGAERVIARFGSESDAGYDEPFPIRLLKITPKDRRFSRELGHRDVLGALMALGIKRQTLGDIVIRDGDAYLFCLERIAPYVEKNLASAGSTRVAVELCETLPEGELFRTEEMKVQCASERIDAVIAAVWNLTRSQSRELFDAQKVFVNGSICACPERNCRSGETVSVRGRGKFVFRITASETRKGRLNIIIDRYV